jgi:hypothetical protein
MNCNFGKVCHKPGGLLLQILSCEDNIQTPLQGPVLQWNAIPRSSSHDDGIFLSRILSFGSYPGEKRHFGPARNEEKVTILFIISPEYKNAAMQYVLQTPWQVSFDTNAPIGTGSRDKFQFCRHDSL